MARSWNIQEHLCGLKDVMDRAWQYLCFFSLVSPGEWVTVEGRFRCVSLTCMSSSCPRSPQGLSPSAHLADGTGDLILVWDTHPLGFLKFLYRHTSTQDQVWPRSPLNKTGWLFETWLTLSFSLLVRPAVCGGPSCEGCPFLPPRWQGRIWRDWGDEFRVWWRSQRLCGAWKQEWVSAAPDRERNRAREDHRAENSELPLVWSVL